jgi:TonB dependent receptor.
VDLVDLSIRKKSYNNIFSLNFTNLLNERYEKPATYSQDGRQFRIGFSKLY